MQPRFRDGLLALGGLCGLIGTAALTVGIGGLIDPLGIVSGIVTAVAVEVLFLTYPLQTMRVWERPGVPIAGLCLVLAAGVVAVTYAPLLLAVAVWGLVTYLALLGCVLVGIENPVSVLLRA